MDWAACTSEGIEIKGRRREERKYGREEEVEKGKERKQEKRKGERIDFRLQGLAGSVSFLAKVTWRHLTSSAHMRPETLGFYLMLIAGCHNMRSSTDHFFCINQWSSFLMGEIGRLSSHRKILKRTRRRRRLLWFFSKEQLKGISPNRLMESKCLRSGIWAVDQKTEQVHGFNLIIF